MLEGDGPEPGLGDSLLSRRLFCAASKTAGYQEVGTVYAARGGRRDV